MKKSVIPLIIAVCLNLSCEQDDITGERNHDNIDWQLTLIIKNSHKYLEFTYDSLNRLIWSDLYYSDTSCSRTIYWYDAENRLAGKSHDGYNETYEYDSNGLPQILIKTYPSTDKVWKRVFLYENGQISQAEIYYNNVQTDYALYEYDSKENTAEVREYSLSYENSEFIMVHWKFKYDDALNPLTQIGYTPIDLVQSNNPTYSYFGNALLCRGPVEYNAVFEYSGNGLPLKEYRTYKGSSDADEFTYNYQLIIK